MSVDIKSLAALGSYESYFKNEINELAKATTLSDELVMCRCRIHLVIKTMNEIQGKIEEQTEVDVVANLFKSYLNAEQALDKIVLRVESIVKTMSSIETDSLVRLKTQINIDQLTKTGKAILINTQKSAVQLQLLRHQEAQIRKEQGGTSKVDDYIDSLTSGKDTVIK